MTLSNIAYSMNAAPCGPAYAEEVGEPVFVTPCHKEANGRAVMLDDSAFASYASFSWSSSNVILAQGRQGALRYKRYHQMARFSGASMPRDLRPGYRITRSWDGVTLEVVSARRGYDHIECELVEVAKPTVS